MKLLFYVEIIDKILVFFIGGKFFIFGVDWFLGGCGYGELICFMVEMDEV